MPLLLAVFAGYLLGSIPFSYLVARRHGVDVRRVGSGNVGATNVMRTVGKAAGVSAFLLDSGKGVLAVLGARALDQGTVVETVAAVAAIIGHLYPVWLAGRGGKGVATGAGTFLVLAPLPTALGVAVFALALGALRYVSVASLAGTLAMAGFTLVLGAPRPVVVAASAVAVLIVWKHRTNIRRILAGTENRLGKKKQAES